MKLRDPYSKEIYLCYLVPFWLTVVFMVVMSFIVGIQDYTNHYAARMCHRYAATSQRETRFAYYGFWSHDCLTPNPNQPGTWVPTDKIVTVGNVSR